MFLPSRMLESSQFSLLGRCGSNSGEPVFIVNALQSQHFCRGIGPMRKAQTCTCGFCRIKFGHGTVCGCGIQTLFAVFDAKSDAKSDAMRRVMRKSSKLPKRAQPPNTPCGPCNLFISHPHLSLALRDNGKALYPRVSHINFLHRLRIQPLLALPL
jgi:hypothetical protein